MPKDIIFSKMKKRDYNKELEIVLDKKQFQEDVKNLLLNMLYKIEIAYDDYSKVKVDVLDKNDYIEYLMQKIYEDCDNIELIKTGTEKYKEFIRNNIDYKIDRKNKEIQVYQDEKKMLQAIFDLAQSTNIVPKKYNLLKDATEKFLNTASAMDEGEVIRDFNGWSWSSNNSEIKNIEYNMIYQNLIILVGKSFMESWVNGSNYIVDYIEELYVKMENIYGKKLADKFTKLLYKILMEKYVIENNKKSKIDKTIKELENNLEESEDSIKFLEKLSKEKKELLRDLENTEIKKDKNKKMKRIKELSILMNPILFNKRRDEEKEQLEFLKKLEFDRNEINEEILQLQNIFIECMIYRVKKIETKDEIIKNIKIIRYYNFVLYDNKNYIKDIKKIKLNKLENEIIKLAIEMKVLNNIEYELLKNIFKIRSIDLQNLTVKVKRKEELIAEYMDEETIEEKVKINENEKIKLNRKLKIFL